MKHKNRVTRGYRYLKRHFREWQRPEARALRRMRNLVGCWPRFKSGRIKVLNWDLEFIDAASCLSAFEAIVVKRWDDFRTENPQPVILDCGANIGISVLHFKRLYPTARITGFEPDPKICEVLKNNLLRNDIFDVEVLQIALANEDGEMPFQSDGSDTGRLVPGSDHHSGLFVKTRRLIHYLNQSVDLLKMDIEGAEVDVILDSKNLLTNIRNILIEFHLRVGEPQRVGELLSTLERSGFRVRVNSTQNFINPFIQESNIRDFEQLLILYARNSVISG